jgi:CRISPR-associated protein Cmr6
MLACRRTLANLDLHQGCHAGLLLQRYLHDAVGDKAHTGDKENKGARKTLLQAAQQAIAKAKPLYAIFYKAWKESLAGAFTHDVKFAGRLVLGLGSESPLETGLRLHQTYGVPVLPGSALKGLASHYARQVWGWKHSESSAERGPFDVMFGSSEENGCVIFYDAMITPESLVNSLELDVMTVHHQDYYGQKQDSAGKQHAPSDFDSPTPISFLSIRGGTFTLAVQFAAAGAQVLSEEQRQWQELTRKLLLEALANWGIGGKTNAGYGKIERSVNSVGQ